MNGPEKNEEKERDIGGENGEKGELGGNIQKEKKSKWEIFKQKENEKIRNEPEAPKFAMVGA